MIRYIFGCWLIACLMPAIARAQPLAPAAFTVVPLGVKGGIDESNLSAYLIAPAGTRQYICMDAGTLHTGIEKAISNRVFNLPAEQVLRQYIKGYCISHSHLDHLSGLIINSPQDTAKNIYAFAGCISTFKTHYFTNESWSNFANEGEAPQLKKYTYQTLTPGAPVNLQGTAMQVTAYPLSHSNLISTAFLLKSRQDYILYLGDTGADEVEKSSNLQQLWQTVAPLIKNKSLKAIMMEVSFPDEQPDKLLFGHLTPRWLMHELQQLEGYAGAGSLKGFNIIVTHVKPPEKSIERLKMQLNAENKLHLHLIYPEQGRALKL